VNNLITLLKMEKIDFKKQQNLLWNYETLNVFISMF
jgi:hypothetical protein